MLPDVRMCDQGCMSWVLQVSPLGVRVWLCSCVVLLSWFLLLVSSLSLLQVPCLWGSAFEGDVACCGKFILFNCGLFYYFYYLVFVLFGFSSYIVCGVVFVFLVVPIRTVHCWSKWSGVVLSVHQVVCVRG